MIWYQGSDKADIKPSKERYKIAEKLERNGYLKIGDDELTLQPGHLVHVKGSQPLHPVYGYPLDNPMTWDTFVHIYLLTERK
jgi:hypothetical protein